MKQRLHASAYAVGGVQWPKLLARMDSSGTGALEWADFKRGIRAELHASPRDVPDADARRIFCFVDKACMGVVEVGELATFISGGPVDDGLGFYDGASGGGDSDGDDSPFGANHKAATPKARRDVAHHVTFAPTANDEAAAAAAAAAASGQADGADASGGAARLLVSSRSALASIALIALAFASSNNHAAALSASFPTRRNAS